MNQTQSLVFRLLGNMTLTRKALIVFAALLGTRLMINLINAFKQAARLRQLLMKLPSPGIPANRANTLDFYGGIRRGTGKELEPTHHNISKTFIEATIKILDEKRDEGLSVLWMFNPNVTWFAIGIVIVRDMKLTRQLLSSKMLPYLKKGRAYEISQDLIGHGVLSTSGDEWYHQRVVVEKGFTQQLIDKQFPMVTKTAKELVNRLKFMHEECGSERLTINAIEEMLKTTLDILGRVAFSYDIGSLKCKDTKDAPLYDAFYCILDTLEKRIRDPKLLLTKDILPTKMNIDFNASMKKLDRVVSDIIKTREGHLEQKDAEPRDLLDIMLTSFEDDNGRKVRLKKSQVLDNMRTILFAGHDTTGAALTWSLFLLMTRPKVVKKILQEAKRHGPNLEKLTVEGLEESEYLNAVVLEVLRLYPSAGFTRTTLEEITVGKYVLPKGVDIMFLPYLTQRHEKYFKDANSFVPERWMKNEEKLGLQARLAKATLVEAFLPFSLGKRNCVGRKLALLEIRVVLLYILKNFNLHEPKEHGDLFQEVPYMGLTAAPKDVYVSLSPKKQ